MIQLLHLAALSGYLGAWALFVRAFREGGEDLPSYGWKVTAAAGALHVAALVGFSVQYGTLPLSGLGPASSTLALLIVLLVVAASFRADVRPTALFLLPLVLLLLTEALVVGVRPAGQQTAFRGIWFAAHVTITFLGYAGLALASAAALMYVLQFRTLKQKDFGSVFHFFPSLDTLDRLNRVGLEIGLAALTVGLAAGWSWTLTYGRGLELGNPEVIFGVVTWVTYLGAVLLRVLPGGRDERSATATVGAFVLTAAAFGVLRITGGGSGFFL